MTQPRIAEVCNSRTCAHLRVNGDRVSFVSTEQLARYGWIELEEGISNAARERQLPADVKLPRAMVIVHDARGAIFAPCELFIARWKPSGQTIEDVHPDDVRSAERYFGSVDTLRVGTVAIPKGGWGRYLCEVAVIRYHRDAGPTEDHVGDFEHPYELYYSSPVRLYAARRSQAFRLSLPNACVVDGRGFVRP